MEFLFLLNIASAYGISEDKGKGDLFTQPVCNPVENPRSGFKVPINATMQSVIIKVYIYFRVHQGLADTFYLVRRDQMILSTVNQKYRACDLARHFLYSEGLNLVEHLLLRVAACYKTNRSRKQ